MSSLLNRIDPPPRGGRGERQPPQADAVTPVMTVEKVGAGYYLHLPGRRKAAMRMGCCGRVDQSK